MINISTTDKWIELDNMEHPIKAEFNRVWLAGIDISQRGQVIIKCTFGKIDQRKNDNGELENYFNPSQHTFDYPIAKTDLQVKGYGYDQLHADAKAILEAICLSEVTFTIV